MKTFRRNLVTSVTEEVFINTKERMNECLVWLKTTSLLSTTAKALGFVEIHNYSIEALGF